jgi:predicted Fe-Mo cluster-binding NifX family protein
MKIAIPVNESDMKSEVCPSFGRAPYFLLYDTSTKESIFIENPAANSPGGAGIQAAQTLIDQGVKVIIAPRYGENAAKVLIDGEVKVYKNLPGSAESNLAAYQDNRLEYLADIHPGFHHHGR